VTRTRGLVVLLVLLGSSWSSGSTLANDSPADLLLYGGTIYTLENDEPSPVEALALRGSEVVAAGDLSKVEGLIGPDARRIDLKGAVALPGLVDAHAHLANLGLSLSRAQLRGTASAAECVQRAREIEPTLSPGQWLLGRGWDQNDWADTRFPGRHLLDAAFGDRPVSLTRVDGHAVWVNRAALRAAGIDRDTPNPAGGEIMRDPGTGEATGVLVDDAVDLVRDIQPELSREQWEHTLLRAMREAVSQGLSCVHEMGTTQEQLAALHELERRAELPLRVVVYLGGEEALDAYEGGPRGLGDHALLRIEGVKLYADGALGSRGAALLEDYSDRKGHRGLLVNSPELLRRASARAFARGLGVAIHAIGDRGNRLALDALELAAADARADRPELPELSGLHARVEHAQILTPTDIPRFARLGVIASMQPTHCTSDMPWAPSRLGDERIAGAYAWRSLRNTGCILPLGSDFPVEEAAPKLGIFAAQTRRAVGSATSTAWSLGEALTPLESVLGFTLWPSQVLGIERRGRLVAGYVADVSVFDADPFGEPDRFVDSQVWLTIVEGRVSFERQVAPRAAADH
jgi:predicted amidohydrolase YtcJ